MLKTILSAVLISSVLLFNPIASANKKTMKNIPLLPKPVEMNIGNGHFVLKNNLTIGVSDSKLMPAAEYLKSMITQATAFNILVKQGNGDIQLSVDSPLAQKGAYKLNVTSNQIQLTGDSYSGVINGIASLRQLLPVDFEKTANLNKSVKWVVPAVDIKDSPRLGWRGLMLDASRHFWNKEEVLKILDMMALYKLNKFHWHLTDDQGWRIEIKQYPLLTEKGAWRKFNSHDKSCMSMAKKQDNPDFNIPKDKLRVINGDTLYGGFYTQNDIREIVAYATKRGIDVIPEIDMPGHFLAAVNNYPFVACEGLIGWGTTFSSPICAGKDIALEFCKNVYKEVFSLFPYEYVHLGADEVEKTNWKKCADCQNRMMQEKLDTPEALQAWFVHNMEDYFNQNGRKLIGWDEILEGGLSETATIMWWRGWHPQSVPDATAQGNYAIMSPSFCLYFDALQDKNTLHSVYDFEPVPTTLSATQQQLIKGVQANLWTEWVPSIKRVEYMLMPRMLALSEIAWVEPQVKNKNDFNNRLMAQIPRLDKMNVNYRIPDLEGFHDINAFTDKTTLKLTCLLPKAEIRYTTDGTTPTRKSKLYTTPIIVTKTTDFTFRTFRPDGSACDIIKTRYVKSNFSEAAKNVAIQGNGLKAVWHDFKGERCADIAKAPVKGDYQVDRVSIPKEVKGNIGLILTGYIDVPANGIYTFALNSDDGSTLAIDNEMLIDNDGPHSPREKVSQKALKKGLHPIEIRYFDSNGGILSLSTYNQAGEKIEWPVEQLKY